MTCLKGLLFMLLACLTIILFTYLTVSVFPKKQPTESKDYYRAAVLEVVPFSKSTVSIKEIIEKNLETYQLAVDLASANEVDILVFPESVLFINADDYVEDRSPLIGSIAEDIPDPNEEDYNPCEQNTSQDHSLLRNLSCMAKKSEMFLVVNLVDYKRCADSGNSTDKNATYNCSDEKECPKDGFYIYNTNVVFNRGGKLIARYHKKHLYSEPTMDPSKCPENGYFETEFGNFTTIICFDILFKESSESIEQTRVSNLAYPYYWYDHTPFIFFANIFQQAFAIDNGINLLAANGHVPGSGTLGSGIFSGSNGALINTHQPDGRTKLLISNIPKDPKKYALNLNDLNRKRFELENGTFHDAELEDNFIFDNECEINVIGPPKDMTKDYRCDSNNFTDFEFRKLEKTEDFVRVCTKDFCCDFAYKANSMDEDYFVAAFTSDFKWYELYNYGVEMCFVARCNTTDSERCASFLLKSETIFEKAELKGTFTTKYIYPFSVDSDLRFTKRDKWKFDEKSQIHYSNSNDNSSLLFFGLYGRSFAFRY